MSSPFQKSFIAKSPIDMHNGEKHPGLASEETSEIKKDDKSEYSLVTDAWGGTEGLNIGDTIRPGNGKTFNPNKVEGNVLASSTDFDYKRKNKNNIVLGDIMLPLKTTKKKEQDK